MYGWHQRIVHIDLTRRTWTVEEPERAMLRRNIGGKGLAGHYLAAHATRAWDDPLMPLCLMTGPLVGTIAPTSGRSCFMARSPLTGTVADSSVGGRLGTQLKRAGWDGLVITGHSHTPCLIDIRDNTVHIRPEPQLAGATTEDIFTTLLDGHKNASVACIGPAAECGVRFASIAVDRHHAAGRGGLGAVFAAKGLKAIRVSGSGRVPVADRAGLKEAREEIVRLTNASPVLLGQQGFGCFGTGSIFDLMDGRSMMPTDNFRATRFEAAPSLNAFAYKKRYSPQRHGCKGCHILCKKVARSGGRQGQAMPEFETMSHFTALIGNTDMDMVMEANRLCNLYGMDTISAGSTLACHMELTGETMTPERVVHLLHDMGQGRDIGRQLGMGSMLYARQLGHAGASMSVKGMELPAYDPRGAYGMALAYATSTRGGCHLRAYPVSHEILRKPVATDRFSFSGKARIIKIAEDQNAVADSLTACKFIFFAATLEEYARALAAVTGEDTSGQELMRAGERIYYRERMMNAHNGFDIRHDELPERFFIEAGTALADLEIPALLREDFEKTRARYYRVRGLDQHGRPIAEKIRELGLEASL